jgi:hypothetical protein
MGSLAHFHVDMIRKRHGLKAFVETGTGDGTGVAVALAAGFEQVETVEIVRELVGAARVRFGRHPGVRVWHGDSREVLPMLLAKLPQEPVLFWLDAHFPGADYGMGTYEGEAEAGRRLPLAEEVALISGARSGIRDVVLIDDARIYQPGPYGAGDLPEDWPPLKGVKRSLDFVREAFGGTHGIVVDYAAQGYVMVCPHA